jgi:hypothetical protein
MSFGISVFLLSLAFSQEPSSGQATPDLIGFQQLSSNLGSISQTYYVSDQTDGSKVYWAFLEYSFSPIDQSIRENWQRPVDRRLAAIAVVSSAEHPAQSFVFQGNRYEDEIQLRIASRGIFEQLKLQPTVPESVFAEKMFLQADRLPLQLSLDSFARIYFQERAALKSISEENFPYRWKPKNVQAGVMLTGGLWMDAILETFELISKSDEFPLTSRELGFLSISYVAKRLALSAKAHPQMSLEELNKALFVLQKNSPTLSAKEIYEWDETRLASLAGGELVFKGLSGKALVKIAAHYYANLPESSKSEELFAAWRTTVSMTCAQPKTLHTAVTTEGNSEYFGYQWAYTQASKSSEKTSVTNFHYSFLFKDEEIRMQKGTRGWPDSIKMFSIQRDSAQPAR